MLFHWFQMFCLWQNWFYGDLFFATSHGKRQEKGQRSEWSKALSLFYDAKSAGPDVHVVQQLLAACAKVRNWWSQLKGKSCWNMSWEVPGWWRECFLSWKRWIWGERYVMCMISIGLHRKRLDVCVHWCIVYLCIFVYIHMCVCLDVAWP